MPSQAEGRRHRPARHRRQGQVAVDALWAYLVLRSGGGEALSKMIQSGDWNTDACINAGTAVEALNALSRTRRAT